MAARLPRLTPPLLALAALGAGARAAAAQAESSAAGWRQVVTRSDIERAGVMRLGELVRLARGWDAVTVDEYTWRASPGALAPLEEDAWMVTLDGHQIEPALLGVLALERLPIDIGSVDSVVFVSAPSLAAGRIAGRGLLQVYSAHAQAGLQARARFTTGAETGDPGPYAFLPGSVSNRDRFGNDVSLGMAYGGQGWHADMSLGVGVHFATDEAIRDRLLATGAFPRIERAAQSLRVSVGEHHFSAGRSAIDDWFRLEARGVEVPSHSTLERAGLDGTIGAGTTRVGYRLGYEHSELQSLAFAQPVLDLATRTLRADVVVRGADRQAGIGIAHTSVLRPGEIPDARTLEPHAFGALQWRIGPAHQQSATAALATAHGLVGAGAVFRHRWRASDRGMATLQLALDLPLPAGAAPRARRAGADLAWSHRISPSLSVSAGALYRAFRSGNGQAGGLVLGTEVTGHRTSLRGWYRYRTELPRHAAAVDVTVAPVHSLELTGRLAARGAARRVGGALTADLGVQKWFWERRLRARIGARNLFDARDVTHPEGGSSRRAFIVAAEARFP